MCVYTHTYMFKHQDKDFQEKKWLYFDPHLIEILTTYLFLEKASLTWAHNWIKEVEIFTI